MNDFRRDDQWQRGIRDSILVPQFYKKYATDGRYVLLDKGRMAELLQKRNAVDTIVQGKDGGVVAIEEKIVRWPGYEYQAFTLETHSCTKPGYESDGWMVYGKADYLLYGCMRADNGMTARLVDFPKLCEWFWPRVQTFPTFGPLKTLNATMGRKVPVKDIEASVPTWRFDFHPPEPDSSVVEAA